MCAPARLHTRHPAWCDTSRCDLAGVDPVHVARTDIELDMPGADEIRLFRVDEHSVHTGEPLPPIYGVELLVAVDPGIVSTGLVRVMLSDDDLGRLGQVRDELAALRERDQR